jgi:hypothetical protein
MSFYANNVGGFVSTTTSAGAINSLYIGTSTLSLLANSATNTNINNLKDIQLYIDGAIAKLAKKTINGTDTGAALVIDSATSSIATTTNAYTVTFRIYSDNAGSPNTAMGSVVTIPLKLITSKSDGEWYRISGFSCPVLANTQYHIVLTTSNADASNYLVWKKTTTGRYPFGFEGLLGYCPHGWWWVFV